MHGRDRILLATLPTSHSQNLCHVLNLLFNRMNKISRIDRISKADSAFVFHPVHPVGILESKSLSTHAKTGTGREATPSWFHLYSPCLRRHGLSGCAGVFGGRLTP